MKRLGERNTFLRSCHLQIGWTTFHPRQQLWICPGSGKINGRQVPERAEYIRVIMAELTRVMSHLFSAGFLLNDLGAYFTPSLYVIEERELILDIFEEVSGSRMMCNYFRFGGVVRDLAGRFADQDQKTGHGPHSRKLEDLDNYLTKNEIVRSRCEGIGVLTAEDAIALLHQVPCCGLYNSVPYDIRRADPYSIYDRFDFDVVVKYHGDIYDRYLVRMAEIRQSLQILEQAIRDIPEGPILAGKPQYTVRVPAGEHMGELKHPKVNWGIMLCPMENPILTDTTYGLHLLLT